MEIRELRALGSIKFDGCGSGLGEEFEGCRGSVRGCVDVFDSGQIEWDSAGYACMRRAGTEVRLEVEDNLVGPNCRWHIGTRKKRKRRKLRGGLLVGLSLLLLQCCATRERELADGHWQLARPNGWVS